MNLQVVVFVVLSVFGLGGMSSWPNENNAHAQHVLFETDSRQFYRGAYDNACAEGGVYNSAKLLVVMEDKTNRKEKGYSLPWIRFTTVATVIVAIDSVACVALWIAGGNSEYLEKNVKHFSLLKSTFDLACIAALRGVTLIALLYLLERAVIRDVSLSTAAKSRRRAASNYNIMLHIFILLAAFACLCYAAVKGGLIIHDWREGKHMHVTYKALCIVAVIFPLVELVVGAASFYYMRKLRTRQVMLIVNETEGQEQDGMTDEEKSKASFRTANLRRLLLMAQPVSVVLSLLCDASYTHMVRKFDRKIFTVEQELQNFFPLIVLSYTVIHTHV